MLTPKESIYDGYVPGVFPEPDLYSGSAYWFVFSGNKLLVRSGAGAAQPEPLRESGTAGRELLPPVPACPLPEAGENLYLGTWEGVPCYTVQAGSDAAAPEGWTFAMLRTLNGAFGDGFFHLAGRAFQVGEWNQAHRFCGRCGTPMADSDKERSKRCPSCGLMSYPPVSPAVITMILDGDRILLAHAANFAGNIHGLIAGFVEPGETLEDAVRREILEEVGVKVRNIRYFGSQQWPFPNSLMIGFLADYESGEICVDGEEIVTAGWFDAASLPELPPPISIARKMIDWYASQYAGANR